MDVPDDPEHRTDQQAHRATGNYPCSTSAVPGNMEPSRRFLPILPCHFCSRDKNHSSQKFHLNDFFVCRTNAIRNWNKPIYQTKPVTFSALRQHGIRSSAVCTGGRLGRHIFIVWHGQALCASSDENAPHVWQQYHISCFCFMFWQQCVKQSGIFGQRLIICKTSRCMKAGLVDHINFFRIPLPPVQPNERFSHPSRYSCTAVISSWPGRLSQKSTYCCWALNKRVFPSTFFR